MIVTLTSIPPRFAHLGPTLESVLSQNHAPDAIQLWIPRKYRRFPDWDGVLPKVPKGVKICRSNRDFGPATKVLPAVANLRGKNVDIVFCDDDQIYPAEWLAAFAKFRKVRPDDVLATLGFQASPVFGGTGKRAFKPRAMRRWRKTDIRYHAHGFLLRALSKIHGRDLGGPVRRVFLRSGYVDVFEGRGGVMLRPDHLPDEAFEIPPILWTVDDVWLSGMAKQAGNHIWLFANQRDPSAAGAEQIDGLAEQIIEGADRQMANQKAIDYMRENYGIWP